ncbi:MAG: glycosyltransferase family 4 protein [Pseudomonadota bacterium]
MLGFRNQGALPAIYAAANLLVLPSITETWGLVVNEAFSLGLPALVSDRVGCGPDMIAGRDTGAVFTHDDEAALASALGEALSRPERLAGWGRNAQALAKAEFGFDAMSQGVVHMLEQA